MKKFLLALFLVLFPISVLAAPFLVCDPQAGVMYYRLTGPGWVLSPVPAQPDGSIKMDVSSSTVGSNALTIAACATDPEWGEVCSLSVPFSFTRPSPPSTPISIKLIP